MPCFFTDGKYMSYEFKIAFKYLFSRSKERFISVISLISVVGVATGVATLIIVIGVMSGFDHELRDRIIGTSSHILVDKLGGIDDVTPVIEGIKEVDGVVACAPFVTTQGLLLAQDQMVSVVVRGVDEDLEAQVTQVNQFIKKGTLDLKSGDNIIIGKILARKLFIKVGDQISLISAGKLKKNKLTKVRENTFSVAGIFSSEMYDYDTGVVFISLEKARVFADNPILASGISVKIKDIDAAEAVKKQIQKKLGFPYFTRTWMDLNRNLFNALKLEKTAMFVILALIVLVASLNIASSLIMLVMEKTKDIGILRAIGASTASIKIIFTVVGLSIGLIGTILGTAGGLFMAYILKTYKFISLPEDIYYINTLPVKIQTAEVVWITAAAMCITLLATFYPAYQASRLNTVEALRYE